MTIELDTITCADYRDLLAALPDGSVDAVITDPPYGIGLDEWDKPIDIPLFLAECYRVLKPDAWLAFTTQAPIDLDWRLHLRETEFRFRNHVTWVKPNAVTTALALNKRHEELFVYSKGKPEYCKTKDEYFAVKRGEIEARMLKIAALERGISDLRRKLNGGTGINNRSKHHPIHAHQMMGDERFPEYVGFTDVWLYAPENQEHRNNTGDYQHPSRKPLGMFIRIVELLTPQGAIILDPFSGSGTTARACQITGRHFITGDLSPKFVETTKCNLSFPFTEPMFK